MLHSNCSCTPLGPVASDAVDGLRAADHAVLLCSAGDVDKRINSAGGTDIEAGPRRGPIFCLSATLGTSFADSDTSLTTPPIYWRVIDVCGLRTWVTFRSREMLTVGGAGGR